MPRKRSKVKPPKQFKISHKKLSRAIERLNSVPEVPKPRDRIPLSCNASIIKQLTTTANVETIDRRLNWIKMFTTSATRHDWDSFVKTLRLASQNHNYCGVDNVLRNSFFGVLTLPIYKDEKTLRLLLYTIAPCRSEHDIEFCIETILRTFDGKPAKK